MFNSGESLHCFLVGVQIKSYVIATSDLWLFIYASSLLPLLPTPLPYKTWRLRAGLEVEESQPTGRQCRGAVWRHWDSVAELSGTEALRGGPDHRASPSLRQFEWTWTLSFTYTDGWPGAATATGSNPSLGARSLASQALQHEETLLVGVGAAVPSTVPEEWDPPSWAGWPTSWYHWTADSAHFTSAQCPTEVRNYISICERCTVVPCFRKMEGDMMLGVVVR